MPLSVPTHRSELLMLLDDGHAHMGFEEAVRDFPESAMNTPVPNAPYTPWHILEHLRLTQLDMLNYIRDADYVAPKWPDEYWPDREAQADLNAWNTTIRLFRADLVELKAIAADSRLNLAEPIPTNSEHTILRSLYVIAAHNHYHIGEFAALRQVMGTWGAEHDK